MRAFTLEDWPAVVVSAALLAPPLPGQQPCTATAGIERSIELAPSAAAYNAKGDYLKQRGNLDCALLAFQKAVEVDGESWESRFHLGLTYLQKRQLEGALPHLKRAASIRPESLEGRLALGSVLADIGDMEDAAREFSAAIQIHPASTTALFNLARIWVSEGRYSAAIPLLEQALRIGPASIESLLLLGSAHSNHGEADRATRVLGRLIEAYPSHFAGRFNLAAAYAQAEKYAEAAMHFKEAMRLDAGSHLARLFAAKALVNAAGHQEALDLTDRWRKSGPAELDEFEIRSVRGRASLGLGRFEAAVGELRRAAELRPEDPEVEFNLGVALARQRDFDQAREHLERAKTLDSESRDVRFELLAVLRELGDTKAVQEELAVFEARKRRGRSESMADRAAARGNAYLKEGNASAALREYRQAVRHKPEDAKLYYGVSLALASGGAAADGSRGMEGMRIEALEKALALDPSYADAYNELGIIHTQLGRFAEAEQALSAAIEADPQYAAARNNLGVLYGKLGRNEDAEAQFRRALEDDPGYVEALRNHGLTLAALGRLGEAERALQKAAELEPGDAQVKQALGMVLRLREGRRQSAR